MNPPAAARKNTAADEAACARAFDAVRALAQDFSAYAPRYLSSDYQEAEARADFISKFFIALGWDVNHETQRNPYQREVKIERGVDTHGARKRADYAFFIAPDFQNERLFIEAKKPSNDLASADNYFQAIRYAWHKKHPLVVLTNFRELHILDARGKPDIHTALNQCQLRFTLDDYADPEKFARIYYLLARDAVAGGALERWAANQPRRSGRQLKLIKGASQEMDQAFLADLDRYRETLARAFKKENAELDGEILTEITQRTLDRLVFIRFLEDKLILAEPIVEKFGRKKNIWEDFTGHCQKLEKVYNGVVFKPLPALDDARFTDSGGVFAGICEELSGQYSPYDFSSIPIHILGSIYERFLGKVIRATPRQAKVEEKEEVRKAGGVYYTPDYIVRYIVRHTVGELIRDKTPEEIAPMRFADIACGSGSFLLGVFDELLNHHRLWFNANPKEARRQGCQQIDGVWRLPLFIKRQILLNNIYGVDIDHQAVDVAQLSLYLKLLEEETTQSAYQFSLEHHEKLLPILSKNIVCGNSLVGRDASDGELFAHEAVRRLNPMDFEDAFPKVMKAGGFDAIVGNPPYVRQETLGAQFKTYAASRYQTYTSTADLYAYFIERAHRKLKSGGYFGYIVSNKFMRASYGRRLREFLVEQSTLRQIVDFGDLPVFANVATYPVVVITQNAATQLQRFTHAAIRRLDFGLLDKEVAKVGSSLTNTALDNGGWSLACAGLARVYNKIKSAGVPLGEYVNGEIRFGLKTGLNAAFVIDAETRHRLVAADRKSAALIKPFALGDDVRHYEVRDKTRYLICIPCGWTKSQAGRSANWAWFSKNYPAIAGHLSPFQKKAEARGDKGDFWWELRPCDYYTLFEQPKIIFPDISIESRFALVDDCLYSANTTYLIPSGDKYLLAVLNSKLVYAFFKGIASTYRGGYLRWFRQDTMRIPIRRLDLSDKTDRSRHDKIVALVDRMIAAKQQQACAVGEKSRDYFAAECASLDRRIDEEVYALYGLTEQEIALIEADSGTGEGGRT